MGYQLQAGKSVSDRIKRIVQEQIECAIDQLTNQIDDKPDEAVHNTRKAFKKIRAVLRLVQDELGKSCYQQENAYFRDTGRHLSDVRDAQVQIETLDQLVQHFSEFLIPDVFHTARYLLEAHYESVRESVLNDVDAIASLIPGLKDAHKRVGHWPIQQEGWSALEGGLKRVYKRGKEAFFVACDRPTPENLHEWRKQVKHLWYHLRIVKPIWPVMLSELIDQAKTLSDDLGVDHDLSVLRQFVVDASDQFEDSNELELLLFLIQQRQKQLQTSARFLGQRLYAEKASSFVRRLESYWQAWNAESNYRLEIISTEATPMHHLPAIEAIR